MQGLAGKTVIVTGGGGGIGNATSERLAQEGAQVAVLDRDLAAAQATAQRITAAGGKALAVAADITRRSEVDAAVQAVHTGEYEHAVNFTGGLHHAMPVAASGFCIYNDAAIGIQWLLDQGKAQRTRSTGGDGRALRADPGGGEGAAYAEGGAQGQGGDVLGLGRKAQVEDPQVLAVLTETRSGRAFTLLAQATGMMGRGAMAPATS